MKEVHNVVYIVHFVSRPYRETVGPFYFPTSGLTMKGNDYQIEAEREQEEQYKLSGDIARVVSDRQSADWPPPVWEVLTFKYLHNARYRATLGALGIMAGYQV